MPIDTFRQPRGAPSFPRHNNEVGGLARLVPVSTRPKLRWCSPSAPFRADVEPHHTGTRTAAGARVALDPIKPLLARVAAARSPDQFNSAVSWFQTADPGSRCGA